MILDLNIHSKLLKLNAHHIKKDNVLSLRWDHGKKYSITPHLNYPQPPPFRLGCWRANRQRGACCPCHDCWVFCFWVGGFPLFYLSGPVSVHRNVVGVFSVTVLVGWMRCVAVAYSRLVCQGLGCAGVDGLCLEFVRHRQFFYGWFG